MRTLRSLITLAGERWSVKACWSSEEPERLQAYPEQRGRTHVEAGRLMGVVDVTASISSYKTPRGSDGHRGGKMRRGERECDPSRGSRFAAKTPGPGSLRREVTDTPRYVNIAGRVRWSGPCTLGNPPSRMDTWEGTQGRLEGPPPPPLLIHLPVPVEAETTLGLVHIGRLPDSPDSSYACGRTMTVWTQWLDYEKKSEVMICGGTSVT